MFVLERFRERLARSHLIPEGSTVLVGYSGGADSTCLTHLLYECGVDVIAAHLHHGQRAEADEELANCEDFCAKLGILLMSGKADVPALARESKVGLEEAGRRARYQFLNAAAESAGADLIATAHTRDDVVETALFNATRGAGLAGLAGIPERRENIIRPLLAFTREETREWCRQHGFWTHDDPANTDLSFARARIRLRVLPELRQVNSEADANLARLAQTAREEDEFLDGAAANALERCEQRLNGDLAFLTKDCEFAFDAALLRHLPDVLLRRAVRLAAEALGGVLDWNQTLTASEGLRRSNSGAVTAERGQVRLEWNTNRLHAHRADPFPPFRYGVTVPGAVESTEAGWVLAAQNGSPRGPQHRASLQTFVEDSAVKGALYFRNAKHGDQMTPFGFSGRRKVADLLSEAHLTLTARQRLPVVCDMIGPVWIPGVCLDERVRIRSGTNRALHLSFGALGPERIIRNGPPASSVR